MLLSAGACVGSLLSLVIWINVDNSSLVLKSLLGSADDGLLELLLLLDLWSLVSNLTVTCEGSVFLAYTVVISQRAAITYPFFFY